jgi:hypothetical protein
VTFGQRDGAKLRSANGELSIPKGFKVLKLKDPPPERDQDSLLNSPPPDRGGSAESPVEPGNLVDVQLAVQKQAHQLKIHHTGGDDFWIKGPAGHERMGKKAALISLVRDHGLRAPQAREMLKEAVACAVHRRPAIYLIKYAYGFGGSLQPGPGAPAMPPPMMGTEQHGPNHTPAIYPQEEFMPVDGMSAQMTNPSVYDPFYMPDQGAMQVAQQASQQGQKEVFDVSMVSGLLKSIGQHDLVDKYLGDLMKALDKVCRIYFLFLWHNEEFQDRYGKQDLPELEDSLRNTIEALGDLVLYLKQKTVNGGERLESTRPEPDVTEAANN